MPNTEIIPAILVNSFEEFDEKVKQVENLVNWVQLDVADGDFAPRKSWGNPVQIHDYDPGVFMEVHLMVNAPEKVIDEWLEGGSEEKDSGIRRIYFHYEATSKHEEIIKKIKDAGVEVGIAVLPDTPLSVIKFLDELVDAVLVFSGSLGYYGGEFNEEIALGKISALHKKHPHITIEVDGGMNPENAKKVVDAGANAVVSGSYIWESEDVRGAIEKLNASVTGNM